MKLRRLAAILGPGLALAATGVGAGDLMAALVAGADHGLVLGWAVVLGAAIKLTMNESLARWQLATGTTLIEGWSRHLGAWFRVVLLIYLAIWTFVVAGGLMSACGLAAHAVLPALTIGQWAVIHSLVIAAVVWIGRYDVFERAMKVMIGVMVGTLFVSVGLVGADLFAALRGVLVPALPSGSAPAVVSLMGGVGGSVTMLAYGYWIRERGWRGAANLPEVRWDLAVGYLLTGAFGVAMLWVAASVLAGQSLPVGSAGLVACGDAIGDGATARLGAVAGQVARGAFLAGVWAAVATSMLGVWQGVPYLCVDLWQELGRRRSAPVDPRGLPYRAVLLWLAVPPMAMLVFDRPVWVVRLYTVASGLFMPLLAGTLLWLGSRRRLMGGLANRWWSNLGLAVALGLFVVLAARQLADALGGG